MYSKITVSFHDPCNWQLEDPLKCIFSSVGVNIPPSSNSAYTNSNNALIIDVTNFSILQHRCDVIDFGQTLVYEMRYLTGKTSILLQISQVFLMFRS